MLWCSFKALGAFGSYDGYTKEDVDLRVNIYF